ncbi:MAG TPA: outer membrane protein assembly factor BamE [Acidiferrobacteraceae bacterium]|nr:outer membrane protein assembly factor BamE [Acidiferrobacteraceae bacterium]
MQKTLFLLALIATSLLAGCYYKMDIQQGNIVTPEMVEQLKPGMTKRQIRYLLGTPLVHDPFHQQRWDYVYSLRKNGKKILEKNSLSLYFTEDILSRIDHHGDDPTQAVKTTEKAKTLSAEDTIVVKGDAKEVQAATGQKKKGIIGRTWDKINPF